MLPYASWKRQEALGCRWRVCRPIVIVLVVGVCTNSSLNPSTSLQAMVLKPKFPNPAACMKQQAEPRHITARGSTMLQAAVHLDGAIHAVCQGQRTPHHPPLRSSRGVGYQHQQPGGLTAL